MTSEDAWTRTWRVFHDALEHHGDARRVYLDDACEGDARLRRQIDDLINALDRDPDFLETPAILPLDPEATDPSLLVGQTIGSFRIVRLIGAGGMGLVYEARQDEPIKRTVAVKLIKPGMDSSEAVSRFLAERQALALMRHSNIAHVYDAGVTAQGRLYFVMEYVSGAPIDKYCDTARLALPGRFALFIKLCNAVHYAHQKGVIHRDIKPANVLVTDQSGGPEIKIIDFGIAKALHPSTRPAAFETGAQRALGTREYMSPEQARSGGIDVDTRTDIYSLGVLLFRLACGALPFDVPIEDKQYANSPPAMSRRLQQAQESERIAEQRATTPARLYKILRGELDWIVAKALAPERERRYASAQDLAGDLRRWREGRAVEAGPPSKLYQFRKFARRNRLILGFSTALAAAILVGGVAAGVGWVRALNSERLATAQAERAVATRDFLIALLQQAGPSVARGRDTTILLDMARTADQRLEQHTLAHRETQFEIRRTLGELYLQLAQYDDATRHLVEARDLAKEIYGEENPETATIYALLGAVYTDTAQLDAARENLVTAIDSFKSAFAASPQSKAKFPNYVRAESNLAETLLRLEDFANAKSHGFAAVKAAQDADPLLRVSAQNAYARVLSFGGDMEEARAIYEDTIAFARKSGVSEWEFANTLGHYGSFLNRLDDYAPAEAAIRESLEIFERLAGPEHDRVARALNTLALILGNQERFSEAHALYERTLKIQKELLPANHPDIAKTYYNMGRDGALQGHYAEAAQYMRQSLEINRDHYPDSHSYIIEDTARIGGLMLAAGDGSGAARWLGSFLAKHDESEGKQHWRLVEARIDYGAALIDLARYDEARVQLTRAEKELHAYPEGVEQRLADKAYPALMALETAIGDQQAALAWSKKRNDINPL